MKPKSLGQNIIFNQFGVITTEKVEQVSLKIFLFERTGSHSRFFNLEVFIAITI